jgi:putative tryptophan/tyrosine transport system substrate-binding protein
MYLGALAVALFLFVVLPAAEAQQTAKVPRIGFLRSGPPPQAFVEGFQQGLRELGYVEGRNIIVE